MAIFRRNRLKGQPGCRDCHGSGRAQGMDGSFGVCGCVSARLDQQMQHMEERRDWLLDNRPEVSPDEGKPADLTQMQANMDYAKDQEARVKAGEITACCKQDTCTCGMRLRYKDGKCFREQ